MELVFESGDQGEAIINRLAQDRLLYHHNRICSEHRVLRPRSPHRQRLLPRQSLRALLWPLSGQRSFINIGRLHGERNSRVAQKLLASRRCRSKNDHVNVVASPVGPNFPTTNF